jgi:hypothetical protein
MTRHHLEKTALSVSQCEKILAESREGEARLTESEDSRAHFRMSLGLRPALSGCDKQPTAINEESPEPTKTKRVRVGQRRPRRDAVGRAAVAHV